MTNMFDVKVLLIEAWRQDPKPLTALAKEIGISFVVLNRFMKTDKVARIENLGKIANWVAGKKI